METKRRLYIFPSDNPKIASLEAYGIGTKTLRVVADNAPVGEKPWAIILDTLTYHRNNKLDLITTKPHNADQVPRITLHNTNIGIIMDKERFAQLPYTDIIQTDTSILFPKFNTFDNGTIDFFIYDRETMEYAVIAKQLNSLFLAAVNDNAKCD